MPRCQLATGFLVPRQCENAATAVCTQCGRPICFVHTAASDTGTVCTVCYSGSGRYYDEDEMYDDSTDDTSDVFTDDDNELFERDDDDDDGELS